MASSFAAEFTG